MESARASCTATSPFRLCCRRRGPAAFKGRTAVADLSCWTSVGIKVSVRCCPFVQTDKLGVKLTTLDDENGEVELIHTKVCTYCSLSGI